MLPILSELSLPRWRRYQRKVLNTARANLIGYWPMWETAGSVALDYSGRGNHGAYTGVTLASAAAPMGRGSPLFDGLTDFNNIYSPALNADFNGQLFSFGGWFRLSAASVWTDSTLRIFARLRVSANHEVQIGRTVVDNQIRGFYRAGGTDNSVGDTSLGGSVAWEHFMVTVSLAADEMKFYVNGVQSGSTRTGLGTWSGNLSVTTCCLGAASITPTATHSGLLGHTALWTTPLTAAQVKGLAVA